MKVLHRTNAVEFDDMSDYGSYYSDGETSEDLINEKCSTKKKNGDNDFMIPQASFNLSMQQHLSAIDARVSTRSGVSAYRTFDDSDFYLDKMNKPFVPKGKGTSSCTSYVGGGNGAVSCVIVDIAHPLQYKDIRSDYYSQFPQFMAWTRFSAASTAGSNNQASTVGPNHDFPLMVHNVYRELYCDYQVRFIHYASPSAEKLNSLVNCRRDTSPSNGRILFHYVGFGYPDPEDGYIYALNGNNGPMVKYKVKTIFENIRTPSFFVFDCNKSGALLSTLLKHSKKLSAPKGGDDENNANDDNRKKNNNMSTTESWDDWIGVCATGFKETMPKNSKLPRDFLTACLLTPIQTSILCHVVQYYSIQYDDPFDYIKSRFNDNRDLVSILHAITDAIASELLSSSLFSRLFRGDPMIADFFHHFLLAQFLMNPYGVHPLSYPILPERIYIHPLWMEWTSIIDTVITSTLCPLPSFSNNFFGRVSTVFNSMIATQQPTKRSLLTLMCHVVFSKAPNALGCILHLAEFAAKNKENRTDISSSINFNALIKILVRSSKKKDDEKMLKNEENKILENKKKISENDAKMMKNNERISEKFQKYQKLIENDEKMSKEEFHALCFLIISLLQHDLNFIFNMKTDIDFSSLSNFIFDDNENQITRSFVCAIFAAAVSSVRTIQLFCSTRDFLVRLKEGIPKFTPQLLLWALILLKRTFGVSSADEEKFAKDSVHMQVAACIFHNAQECRAATVSALSCFMQPSESAINHCLFLIAFPSFCDMSYLVRYQHLLYIIRFLTTHQKMFDIGSGSNSALNQIGTSSGSIGCVCRSVVMNLRNNLGNNTTIGNNNITNNIGNNLIGNNFIGNNVNNIIGSNNIGSARSSLNNLQLIMESQIGQNDAKSFRASLMKWLIVESYDFTQDFETLAKSVDVVLKRDDVRTHVYRMSLFLLDYFTADPHPSIRTTAMKARKLLYINSEVNGSSGSLAGLAAGGCASENDASADMGNYRKVFGNGNNGNLTNTINNNVSNLLSGSSSPPFNSGNANNNNNNNNTNNNNNNKSCPSCFSISPPFGSPPFNSAIAGNTNNSSNSNNSNNSNNSISNNSSSSTSNLKDLKEFKNITQRSCSHQQLKQLRDEPLETSESSNDSSQSMVFESDSDALFNISLRRIVASGQFSPPEVVEEAYLGDNQRRNKIRRSSNTGSIEIPSVKVQLRARTKELVSSPTLFAYDHDTLNMAVATKNKYVYFFNESLFVQSKIRVSDFNVTDVGFVNDHSKSLCAIATCDGCIHLWDKVHKEPCASWRSCPLYKNMSMPQYFAVSEVNSQIISARGPSGIYAWDIQSQKLVNEVYTAKDYKDVSSILCHPNNNNIVVVGYTSGQFVALDMRSNGECSTSGNSGPIGNTGTNGNVGNFGNCGQNSDFNSIVSFTLGEKIVKLASNRNGADFVYAATSNGNIIVWNSSTNAITTSYASRKFGISHFSAHQMLPLLAFTNKSERPTIISQHNQVLNKEKTGENDSVLLFHPVLPVITFGAPNGEILSYNINISPEKKNKNKIDRK